MIWVHTRRNGSFKSAAYKKWLLDFSRFVPKGDYPCNRAMVSITFFRATKHRADLDNMIKSVLDACTAAGLWKDDSQVVEIHAKKYIGVGEDRIDMSIEYAE